MWWPLLRFRFESFPFPFKIKRKWRVNLYFNWLEQALSQAPGSSLPHFTWEMDYVISSNSNMINAVAKNELSDQHQEHDQNCHQQDHQHNKKHQHRHHYKWPNDYQMLVFYHQQSMINSGQYKTRRNMGHQVFAEELCVMASSWVSLAMAVPQCAPEHQGCQANKITFFNLRFLFSRCQVSIVEERKETWGLVRSTTFGMELLWDEALWPFWKYFC